MSLTDILIRSICGYIFMIPVLLSYFLYLRIIGKKQTCCHIITAFIFCYYLIGVFTMTGIHRLKSFSPRIVFLPFLDMIKGPIDTILNIILFLPLGVFLPMLYKKYNRISRIALTGFLLSLTIEIIQMFGMGASDINDIITNTVGACLGYYVFKLLFKFTKKESGRKLRAGKINDDIEVFLFISCSFIIMITIQPFLIHKLFRLG